MAVVYNNDVMHPFNSLIIYEICSEIIAAYAALAELSKRPENTIYNAKRFIGQR